MAFEMWARRCADGRARFAVVGWKHVVGAAADREFARSDYVGDDALPWKGTQAKRWLGALWMPHSGLTKAGTLRYCSSTPDGDGHAWRARW